MTHARAIIVIPMGTEMLRPWLLGFWLNCSESSRNQTPTFAIRKPRLRTAILVRIHARNVRSEARYSAAVWCAWMGAWCVGFAAASPTEEVALFMRSTVPRDG